MNPLLVMGVVEANPLGMTTRSIAEWYWAKYQLTNTRRDLLNLATFT